MRELTINEELSSYIEFNQHQDKEIEITGQIQNHRPLAWGGFIILRTPNYMLQTVYDKTTLNLDPEEIKIEAVVKIKGKVKEARIKDKSINPRQYEIQVSGIEILGRPQEDPLPIDTTKKELNVGLDTKFEFRTLTLRHTKQRAIFRISAVIYNAFGEYLSSIGFTRICSPKLVSAGAEGGANIFQLDYFGRKAFLAQSPQFYKQMMVAVLGRVFEQAPVFRAEKHDTSRHLNEYISLDYEMMLTQGFEEIIQVEVNTLKYVINKISRECAYEIELLGITLPQIDKIILLEFDEIHQIIYEHYQKDFRSEKDLAPIEENLICQYAKEKWKTDFVFVTHYPSEKRPFYTRDDPEKPGKTLSFDLLFRGMEITTGGQRLNHYSEYIDKMKKYNLDPQDFTSYLQAFKYGMPAHGGLGFGLERFTALICELDNVKEASLFPRDINRLDP